MCIRWAGLIDDVIGWVPQHLTTVIQLECSEYLCWYRLAAATVYHRLLLSTSGCYRLLLSTTGCYRLYHRKTECCWPHGLVRSWWRLVLLQAATNLTAMESVSTNFLETKLWERSGLIMSKGIGTSGNLQIILFFAAIISRNLASCLIQYWCSD